MSNIENMNFGNSTQIYEAPVTEHQEFYYPFVNQIYVQESQLYNVVHAVEYHGTTYFYQDIIDFPVLRLCDVTPYTTENIVDENASNTYWPTENIHSENVEQDIENTQEYDYQSRYLHRNESLPIVDRMPVLENVNQENSMIEYSNKNTENICENEAVHNSNTFAEQFIKVYERKSVQVIESLEYSRNLHQNESLAIVDRMPVLEDVNQENSVIQYNNERPENMHQNEAVLHSNTFAERSLTVYERKSVQVIERREIIEKVCKKGQRIKSNSRNILKIKKYDAVVQESLFGARSKKLDTRESIQNIEKLLAIEENDDAGCIEESCNVKTVKTNCNVDLRNICDEKVKKLYRKRGIQVLNRMSLIKVDANEENVVESSNINVLKLEHAVVKDDRVKQKGKKLNPREHIEMYERRPIMNEVANEECEVKSSSEKILNILRPVVKDDKVEQKGQKLNTIESIQMFERMSILNEVANEECEVKSSSEKILDILRPIVKDDKVEQKGQKLNTRESIQMHERRHITNEVANEECEIKSSSEKILDILRPIIKDDKVEQKGQKLNTVESVQMFERMPIINDVVADVEYEVKSSSDKILNILRPTVKNDKVTKKVKKLNRRKNTQVSERMPIIQDVFDEECIEDTNLMEEFKDAEKNYCSILENNGQIGSQVYVDENESPDKDINVEETVTTTNDNRTETIFIENPPIVNVETLPMDNVEEIKMKNNISRKREIKSQVEELTYESLIPLKDQSKTDKTDIDIKNDENETTQDCSQKPTKERFQSVRKFFGRLLSCCTKGPT